MDKSVTQRNNFNYGLVRISLQKLNSFKTIVLKVEEKQSGWSQEYAFEKRDGIAVLDSSVLLKGGWYSFVFEFHAANGNIISEEVPHVGVGEVFLVAGQSNAQMEGPMPQDDRVVAALFDGGRQGRPSFISLNTTEHKRWVWPSPPGTSFLGSLGDSLVKRLNVPVLFFNAAQGGTSTGDWWTSAVYNEPPYFYVDLMLHKFTFDLGLRGVLWMQGESNSVYQSYNATPEIYRNDVFYMVQKMRDTLDFQQLSWVISLTSWNKAGADPAAGIDPNPWELRKQTRDGQLLLVDSDPDIFLGPDTDILEGLANSTLRSDGTHLTAEGFVLAGLLWNRSLTDEYFERSTPYTGKHFFDIRTEPQKRDQVVVLEDWSIPSGCDWTHLPKALKADLPFHFALSEDSPAELKEDSIRVLGKEGVVGLIVYNEGNDSLNAYSDTVFYSVANLTGTPQVIAEPQDYVTGEVIRLQCQCNPGEVFWREAGGEETQRPELDFVYQKPTEILVFCKAGSCLSDNPLVFNLKGMECENDLENEFSKAEYAIVDNMIRRIETLDIKQVIEIIVNNNLQKKVFLRGGPDDKITLSFNRCKPR